MFLLCAAQHDRGGIPISWQFTKVVTAYKTVCLEFLDQWVDLERYVIVVIEVAGPSLAKGSDLGPTNTTFVPACVILTSICSPDTIWDCPNPHAWCVNDV
jgi:hypothetical protein